MDEIDWSDNTSGHRRRVRRLGEPARRWAGRGAPVIAKDVRQAARPLVRCLVDADEGRRRATVERVRSGIPAIQRLMVNLLAECLHRKDEGVCRRAVASLAALGEAAVAPLSWRLLRSKSVPFRVRLVEALGAIGLSLAPESRVNIQMDLMSAFLQTKDVAVAAACGQALAALRERGGAPPAP
jgi:hypothetical protein